MLDSWAQNGNHRATPFRFAAALHLDGGAMLGRDSFDHPKAHPVPFSALVVKNGSNIFSRIAIAMPEPVSAIVSRTQAVPDRQNLEGRIEMVRTPRVGNGLHCVQQEIVDDLPNLIGNPSIVGAGLTLPDFDLRSRTSGRKPAGSHAPALSDRPSEAPNRPTDQVLTEILSQPGKFLGSGVDQRLCRLVISRSRLQQVKTIHHSVKRVIDFMCQARGQLPGRGEVSTLASCSFASRNAVISVTERSIQLRHRFRLFQGCTRRGDIDVQR